MSSTTSETPSFHPRFRGRAGHLGQTQYEVYGHSWHPEVIIGVVERAGARWRVAWTALGAEPSEPFNSRDVAAAAAWDVYRRAAG